jgi:hypothetical protein
MMVPPKIQIPGIDPFEQMETIALPETAEPPSQTDLSIYKNIQLLTHPADFSMFHMPPPSAHHARAVWMQAGLPPQAIPRLIEVKMIDWLIEQGAELVMEGRTVRSVNFSIDNHTLHFVSWRVFLRWILCACTRSG